MESETLERSEVMAKFRVEMVFDEEILGMTPGDKEIATTFIAAKNPDGLAEDDAEAISRSDAMEATGCDRTWKRIETCGREVGGRAG